MTSITMQCWQRACNYMDVLFLWELVDQIQIRWTDISYDKERAKIIINHPKTYETSSNCSKNEHSSETVTKMINMNSGPSKIHYDLTGHFPIYPLVAWDARHVIFCIYCLLLIFMLCTKNHQGNRSRFLIVGKILKDHSIARCLQALGLINEVRLR